MQQPPQSYTLIHTNHNRTAHIVLTHSPATQTAVRKCAESLSLPVHLYSIFFYTAVSVPHGQGDRPTRTARTGASAASMPSDFGDILPQNSRSTRPAPRPCGGRMRGDARIAPRGVFSTVWEHSRRFPDAFSRFGSVPAARPGAFLRFGSIFGLRAALRQTAIVLAVISRVSMSECQWLY